MLIVLALFIGMAASGVAATNGYPDPLLRSSEPAQVLRIEYEAVKLAAAPGRKWAGGTPLAHVRSGDMPGKGLPVPSALRADTVKVRSGKRTLQQGADYIVNGIYGTLSLGSNSTVDADQTVLVSYEVGLRRLDSVIRQADGLLTLRQGEAHLTAPEPPTLRPGETLVGNYFLDYFSRPEEAAWFPASAAPTEAATATASRGLERTLEKLRTGQPVKIVCWGDSITAGGDASAPDRRYPAIFAELLRQRFPSAKIEVRTVAVGGSQSRQWLHPDQYPHPTVPKSCRFERVVADRPDLITVEFINDAWMSPTAVDAAYTDIQSRIAAEGAEMVLITPSFPFPEMMGTPDLRTSDRRPYVSALKRFALSRHLALADVSARWEHLWREGVPYVTLLKNGINHRDDRGHRIYAEELLKCFP